MPPPPLQARTLGPGNTALTLYARPCDAPGWAEQEAHHEGQRDAMMRYLAQRARLVEAQGDAQAEEYGRRAETLKKHLLTSERGGRVGKGRGGEGREGEGRGGKGREGEGDNKRGISGGPGRNPVMP